MKKWKKKNCCRYHHFTHRYQKPQSLEVQFLRSGVRPNFLSFCAISCPFTPLSTRKIKILKKWKNHLEMSSFYTSAPKNTCLFWYGEWRQFLLFYPILNPNIKIWKICKKHLEIWYVCPTNEDLDVWLLMYKVQEDKNFCLGDISILQLCTTNNNQM